MKFIEDGFFKRNKKIILISLLIFLVFAAASGVISYINVGDDAGMITESFKNAVENGTANPDAEVGISFDYIFIHNLVTDCIVILGGLLFSVVSLILTVINAVSIASIFGVDFTYALLSVLPHAIIEYAASVLALSCAFLITKLEIKIIKKRDFRNTIDESKTELKDIIALIIVIVILLVIAAIIEVYITPMIVDWYFFG